MTGMERVFSLLRSFLRIEMPSSSGSMMSRRMMSGSSEAMAFQKSDGLEKPSASSLEFLKE